MIKIDEELKTFGEENNVPISKTDTLSFLCNEINKNNYREILEIGTAIGYGSITMAENTKLNHIDTVEIDEDRFLLAKSNIKKHNLENKINVIKCDAMDFLKTNKKKYDFIYLDGAKGQYINYLSYLLNSLNSGGEIVADNLYFHGMVTGEIPVSKGCRAMIKGLKKYIEAITTDSTLDSTILPIGDGLGVTRKK